MNEALDGRTEDIGISGYEITNLRYAHDTLLLISIEDEMKAIMQKQGDGHREPWFES